MVWDLVIYALIAAAISYALAPKPPQPTPPSVEDIQAPTAEEGRPLGVVFGTVWVSGPNVTWYGDTSTEPIQK